MTYSGWGNYPKINGQQHTVHQDTDLLNLIQQTPTVIPQGNRRSYGDSALNTHMLDFKKRDYFLDFDAQTGLLHVQAGVLLSDIIDHFLPRGWFLKVTPGTKYITVGGAIASDVHGKNHHKEGCFSECLAALTIMLPSGETVTCTKAQTPDLFKATCGGQGLTGLIVDAKLYLKKVESRFIDQTTIKTRNLEETFEVFEKHKDTPYSMAWIDCLAKGEQIGRSLFMHGQFRTDGDLHYTSKKQTAIPFNFPSFALNHWSVKAFNWLYYHKVRQTVTHQKVDIDTFFYPLDAIRHWNRMYGKPGFVQYQFILPKETSFEGLADILGTIEQSGKGSFLAVLKLYGKANDNWLSFPMEGYSLALDFKLEKNTFALLDKLDQQVLKYRGRFYLAKDARLTKETFEQGYPHIDLFRQYREKHDMAAKFQSLQSKRLGI